jgi:hypothetical protein
MLKSNDNNKSVEKILFKTALISFIFYLILCIISWGDYFDLDPTQIFIAFVPFFIWLILSGKLKEIKGPGGIGLTLSDIGSKPISPDFFELPLAVDPERVTGKGFVDELKEKVGNQPPTTLSFEIGKKRYYGGGAIHHYIEFLEIFPVFQYILFNDKYKRFQGIMTVENFKKVQNRDYKMDNNINGNKFDLVRKIETGSILSEPSVITVTIENNATNKEALVLMDEINENFIPVVKSGKFIGLVTQEEIVRKSFLKLF